MVTEVPWEGTVMRRLLVSTLALAGILLATDAWASGPPSWPVYLRDNSRDNAVQDGGSFGGGALQLAQSWAVGLGGPATASLVIGDYAAYVPGSDGNLYAINLATHQVIWKRFLGTRSTSSGTVGISSTPVYASDLGSKGAVLVGGGGQAQASDTHLYVYALESKTGTILWQTAVGNAARTSISDSPLYMDGHVYVATAGSAGGSVYVLDGQTGTILHKVSMAVPLKKGGGVSGSMSADSAGSRVFVPTGSGQNRRKQKLTFALVALNPQTLTVSGRWQAPAGQAKGKNGFGTSVTVFSSGSRRLIGAGMKSGMYYALDAAHLKKGPVWKRKLGNTGGSAHQVSDVVSAAYASGPGYPDGGALFVAAPNVKGGEVSGSGALFALNPANGHVIWSVPVSGEPQDGAATVYDDLVILAVRNGTGGGAIEVRSAGNGHLLGSMSTTSVPASPVVVLYGDLYFATSDGVFHVVNLKR